MTRRRRLGLLAALAVLLLLAAAAALPARIDWDGYRESLAQNASARLGRPIGLNGGLRLRLLPQTVLEADGLTIGTSGDGVELTARAMRLRLDPWWLMLGRVVVRELVLVGADIRLPWPPGPLPALGELGALTSLDARLEDSRLRIAGASVEGVSARLLAGGPGDTLVAEGRLNWRGQPLSFAASLGRAGDDGTAPLQFSGQASGSRIAARGVLLAEGGFEGRLDAAGADLSALLPTPRGAFTASGRITATAELVGVDDLVLELAGQQARGSVSLRLTPPAPSPVGPRLDAALVASRLDLDAWTQALRDGGTPALPIGLDLSADEATFRGAALRRLRLAVQLENSRILVPEATAELPGEGRITASGAGTANVSEWALRLQARRLQDTLLEMGVDRLLAGALPQAPASATLRLMLDERQAAFSDIAASVDGNRVAGTATWRWGDRPVLGLGLEFARLDLDPWLALGDALGGLDVNLRIGAERAMWRGLLIEALNLDAAAEGGRLVLRRGLGRHAGADLTASASGTLNPPRVQEALLEAQGASLGVLAAHWLTIPASFAALPARLRATFSGTPEALALRGDLTVEDARLEAQLVVDAPQSRAAGTVTLRHPGATRLLGSTIGAGARAWLGDGSLALIAQVALRPGLLAADNLDLVAGALRLRGPLALNLEGPRPRLTGQLSAETLSLPDWPEKLDFTALRAFDMELGLRATALSRQGGPTLEEPRATLRLEAGRLAVERAEARLWTGALTGALRLDTMATPPRWHAEAMLQGAQVVAPLFNQAPDITAGQLDARLALHGDGHSPAAWRASLGGEGEVVLRDGMLSGFDLTALATALAAPGLPGLDEALAAGSTPVTRLALPFTVGAGLLRLGEVAWDSPAGPADAAGQIDLLRDTIDLQINLPQPAGPAIGLRFLGPLDRPRQLADTELQRRWLRERND